MYTRKQFTVAPFLPEYSEQTDVHIVTGVTNFDTNIEMTYVLVFSQRIWFGNRMKKYLMNPNQCWAFGIVICDDTTNKYMYIGIETDETFVTFQTKGTICGTMNREPNNEELENAPRI